MFRQTFVHVARSADLRLCCTVGKLKVKPRKCLL